MNEQEFYKKITEFIYTISEEAKGIKFTEQDDLLQIGILDSFSMVSLITFLESLIATDLPLEEYSLVHFKSLKTIYENIYLKYLIS
ncbi:hypothetical protein [Paenibacillus humicus]|uniref:hypothetical protein n=1 Tax=Paenibacillus humicus TaxID=412861 RepID=UPI003D2C2139